MDDSAHEHETTSSHDAASEVATAAAQGQVIASAAEVYERFFVPALFGQFAPVAVDRSGVGPGDRFLDVACGTGAVARAAAPVVGPDGEVVGIDVNPAMLAVARSLMDEIEWLEAPAETLPVESDSFDAAVCQFGLMFFTDGPAALVEMARAVRPGRPVLCSTWADASASPGYEAMISLLDEEVGPTAAEALRAPFTIGTEDQLAAMMEPAFDHVEVSTEPGFARFASLEAWLHTDIRGWTLAGMIDDEGFERLLQAARVHLDRFVEPSGAVVFEAPAIFTVGTHRG